MAIYKFDDIAFNSKEKKKPTDADKANYIGLEHLIPGTFEVPNYGSDITPKGDKLIMHKGDVLFGKRRAYQKKVAIAPCDGIFSAHGFVLRPKENVIDKNYFPFFISSDQFLNRAIKISVGGLSPTINWSDLKVEEFSLPPLSEQKVLSDKLWAAYRLKESYKKLLQATDDMVKAKFIEMFGLPKETEPQEGTIPLEDVLETNFVGDWGHDDKEENGIKVLTTKNFRNNGYLNFDEIVTRNIPFSKIELKKLHKGDILLERSGGTNDNPVGRTVYFNQDGDYLCNNFVQVLRCKKSVNSLFIATQLRIIYNTQKRFIKTLGNKTTGIQNLNFQKYLGLRIFLPDISEQNSFADIITHAEQTKSSLRASISSIDKVIKSLING